MLITIEERRVYVDEGTKSQTVKICDWRNNRGEYEHYFRIKPCRRDLDRELRQFVTLEKLNKWLRDDVHAVDENGKTSADAGSGGDPPADKDVQSDEPPDGNWLDQAKEAVEDVIAAMVKEFKRFPYLHRVEHCLHTALVQRLRA